MLDSKIRVYWDRGMRPVGGFIAKTRISPNAITLLGVVIQIVVAVEILRGALLVAGLVAIVAALFDVFDGAVAKAKGITSSFGAFLDSTTDRIADALYFGPLAWLYGVRPDTPGRDEPWVAAVALATLVLVFMVSYAKARAEALGYDAKVGLAERAERAIVMIAGLILNLVPAALVIVGVASAITFLQRLFHVRAQAVRGG
ncbi:MAG TPA: CDP-alcohol phosphatidyltransferase family protein [Actinomycetota bacterium]|nr:CDP-alcohol phosphatidyltransferase family protein [Actinomycetota bacterium]